MRGIHKMTYFQFQYVLRSKLVLLLVCGLVACVGCSGSMSKGTGAGSGSGEISDEDLELQNRQRWSDGSIPTAQEDGLFRDIHFEYDSSAVPRSDYDQLQRDAEVLRDDSLLHAEIEGHCDKRGTNEYNLALGEERARAIAELLVSFGVPAAQLSTISYGEEIPLDPEESEAAFARNRRVHFAIYRKKDQ